MYSSLDADRCPRCGFEMATVSATDLRWSMNNIRPKIHSIPPEVLKESRKFYPICPKCDAYALGAEMEEGIPFACRDGRVMTIKEILP